MESITWKQFLLLLLTIFIVQYMVQSVVRSERHSKAASEFGVAKLRPNQSTRPHGGPPQSVANTDECQEHYPSLFHGLDRAISFWKAANRTISNADVDIPSRRGPTITILVRDNEVRVIRTKGVVANTEYRARAIAVLGLIERALWAATAANERLPVIEAAVAVGDVTQSDGASSLDDGSVWTFAVDIHNERHKQHWLLPHYGLYSTLGTGSFETMRKVAQLSDSLFINKVPKLGIERAEVILENQDFEMTEERDLIEESSMTMDEICRYGFTLDREGHDQSLTLLSLLNCNSLLLKTPSNWTAHLHHLLVPGGKQQNYVPIAADLADLAQNMKFFLDYPEKAQQIIQNAVDTFRSQYTTAIATSCYIRRLIVAYSTVSYTPEIEQLSARTVPGTVRGVSFVDFIVLDDDYDEFDI